MMPIVTTRPGDGGQAAARRRVVGGHRGGHRAFGGSRGSLGGLYVPAASRSAPERLIVYTDEAYDALTARLQARPAPNEQLKRTMSGRTVTERVSGETAFASLSSTLFL